MTTLGFFAETARSTPRTDKTAELLTYRPTMYGVSRFACTYNTCMGNVGQLLGNGFREYLIP